MASTAFVRARIDEKLKDEASEVLAEFGLTVSDVVRMTLTRVAKDGAAPLELKVPNEETRRAMLESRRLMKKHNARFHSARGIFRALDEDARKPLNGQTFRAQQRTPGNLPRIGNGYPAADAMTCANSRKPCCC